MPPTQIFLANPAALRVAYRLDDARLILWWSPLAGQSTDCRDRNYSSREARLEVFQSIELPGCDLGQFVDCAYDPYHCVLRFESRLLHLAPAVDTPAVLLWSDGPLTATFSSDRFDRPLQQAARQFSVSHPEPRFRFTFAAALGDGDGGFRHCPFHAEEQPVFTCATVSAGQLLAVGAGLEGDDISAALQRFCSGGAEAFLGTTEAALAPCLVPGRTLSSRYPDLAALRDTVVRGLHSMIDASGAFRASLKAVYYLLWVRDAGFAFAFQAAAGWPHKLPELCRLLLDNPTRVTDSGPPEKRMFGQLIHRRLGKLEEDGLYYVVWTLFTHWTQHGDLAFMTDDDWSLVREATEWVEAATWDEGRGLYGESFADETPTQGSRDHGWDFAIGKPLDGSDVMRHGKDSSLVREPPAGDAEPVPVVRNYDVYFNMLMHSTHSMLAAMTGSSESRARAERVWPELEKLLKTRFGGIPAYGEVLLENGERRISPPWGEARSCAVWGLTMPAFAPLEDWDGVLAAVMDAIIEEPEMHWINGIASAMAAVDPWCYDERKLLVLHQRLAEETGRPGRYLPMGGAMPEKFNAPEGSPHHDIRPQGFAMGAWLAAWSSLGLRRLPHGLALRPTAAFERIEAYPWRGRSLQFAFGPEGRALALEIDGRRLEGTLQVPESHLREDSCIRLVSSAPALLWIRSSVQLNTVHPASGCTGPRNFHCTAFGRSRITLSTAPEAWTLAAPDGSRLPSRGHTADGLFHIDFTHFGQAVVTLSATPA